MTHFRYLSFLTDYGLEDGFVAACHGVGARIAPHADIIDVTHLVPRGDVRRGAAVLAQTVPYLPPAVHVAVVDPGVGTAMVAPGVARRREVASAIAASAAAQPRGSCLCACCSAPRLAAGAASLGQSGPASFSAGSGESLYPHVVHRGTPGSLYASHRLQSVPRPADP